MLSLNQSYFQLVNNQTALTERFNRLEQVVIGRTCLSDTGSADTRQSPQHGRSNLRKGSSPFSSESHAAAERNIQHNARQHGGTFCSCIYCILKHLFIAL
jgi:hypothetical protein